ncbi:MAG: UDP-N-acetylmuramoyl-L-alanyl-D-glutamate--2,6-diaminopimelate ligase [bacterium]
MKLRELVRNLPESKVFGSLDIAIRSLASHSDDVKKGSLFVAVKGLHVDGHKFIKSAIKDGAVVIVGEKKLKPKKYQGVTYVQVPNTRQALGHLASVWYEHPSKKLKVIGITGTDGKTTTANLLWNILNGSGKKAGLISTIGARIGDKIYDTGLHVTNPEALELQKHLALMVSKGCRYAVLEVTSHGIDQGRVTGVHFDTAVLTNITHEHFDYHKNIKNYRRTKSKIFQNVRYAVLNRDDRSYEFFKKVAKGSKIISYTHKSKYAPRATLLGKYNLYNISAATTVAQIYKCSDKKIQQVLEFFPTLPGRMEEIGVKQNFRIFVDFAHTPNALKSVLTSLRILLPKGKKLIVLFGCAGERDTSTRAIRGQIAVRYAHIVIITADDPRTESLSSIYRDIVSNVSKARGRKIIREDDRKKAIAKAFALAEEGDFMLLAGKGHEKSISIGGKELPWSDVEVARSFL